MNLSLRIKLACVVLFVDPKRIVILEVPPFIHVAPNRRCHCVRCNEELYGATIDLPHLKVQKLQEEYMPMCHGCAAKTIAGE